MERIFEAEHDVIKCLTSKDDYDDEWSLHGDSPTVIEGAAQPTRLLARGIVFEKMDTRPMLGVPHHRLVAYDVVVPDVGRRKRETRCKHTAIYEWTGGEYPPVDLMGAIHEAARKKLESITEETVRYQPFEALVAWNAALEAAWEGIPLNNPKHKPMKRAVNSMFSA